jgi:dTDP-glucose 4,6-dehydratase
MEEISENYLFKKDVSNLPLNKRGYALAKRNSESRFAELGKENLSLSIARCFTFVGKYLPLDKHFAIGNFIKNGIEGKPVIVNARNPVIRSYMYADDLVLWLMNIISISNINVPIYNVGSNQEISILELAKLIGNKTKQQVLAQEIIYPAVDRYIPSIEKAQKELNLNLSFNIEQSIDSTLNALLN